MKTYIKHKNIKKYPIFLFHFLKSLKVGNYFFTPLYFLRPISLWFSYFIITLLHCDYNFFFLLYNLCSIYYKVLVLFVRGEFYFFNFFKKRLETQKLLLCVILFLCIWTPRIRDKVINICILNLFDFIHLNILFSFLEFLKIVLHAKQHVNISLVTKIFFLIYIRVSFKESPIF